MTEKRCNNCEHWRIIPGVPAFEPISANGRPIGSTEDTVGNCLVAASGIIVNGRSECIVRENGTLLFDEKNRKK